jgi:hypothetical protein
LPVCCVLRTHRKVGADDGAFGCWLPTVHKEFCLVQLLQQEQSGWHGRKLVSAVSASDAPRSARLAGSASQSRSAPSATVAAGPGFAQGEREVPQRKGLP